jgi:hypothetical protein
VRDTVLLTCTAVAISLASDAHAQTRSGGDMVVRTATPDADAAPKQERRSGLVVGATGLLSAGTAAGYPNQASQIGDPKYLGQGGNMAGGGVNAYVMAALADVFNFGLFFGYTVIANNDWSSEGLGGGFRLEAFPLYSLVPKLKDLGFFAQFGIGSANLLAQHGFYPGADGVQTYVSVGAFYEFTFAKMKHGHFTLAPSLEYDYVGARSIDRHTAGLGLRVAFYSGP